MQALSLVGALQAFARDSRTKCFAAEYARADNRIDVYAPLADADFRPQLTSRDPEWIDRFLLDHRDTMRPWCIEHDLNTDAGLACAKQATTRAEFMACGGD